MRAEMTVASAVKANLSDKLARAIADFGAQLGTSVAGTLTQAWVPEPGDDGGVVLNTQGLPFCVSGTGDLLALFRCISCKYKFGTDIAKPCLMGPGKELCCSSLSHKVQRTLSDDVCGTHHMVAVGRVYTTGEPEVTHSVQKCDQSVYLRVSEAQRCGVNSCLFLPVYASPARTQVTAVLEVAQSDEKALFAALVDWARVCLERSGLWTTDMDTDSLAIGLRSIQATFDVSAIESKNEAKEPAVRRTENGLDTMRTNSLVSMPPPAVPSQPVAFNHASANVAEAVPSQPVAFNHPSASETGTAPAEAVVASPRALALDDAMGEVAKPSGLIFHLKNNFRASGAAELHHSLPLRKIVQVGKSLVLCSDAAQEQQNRNEMLIRKNGAIPLDGNNTTKPVPPPAPPPEAAPPQPPAVVGNEIIKVTYSRGDRALTLADLTQYYHLSMRDAAAKLEIGVTTLKRICRHLGIQRWPRRELRFQSRATAGDSAAAMRGLRATTADGMSCGSGQTISAGSSGEQVLGGTETDPNAAIHPIGSSYFIQKDAVPPEATLGQNYAALPEETLGLGAVAPTTLSGITPDVSQLPPAAAAAAATTMAGEWWLQPGIDDDELLGMESLDILAAMDFDVSVGNSPRCGGALPFSNGAFDPGSIDGFTSAAPVSS